MIIGFTGHRNAICNVQILAQIAREYPGAIWIHGGALGFDTQVDKAARSLGIYPTALIPDYDRHGSSAAPLRRNDEIVHLSDLLVACYDGRGHGGTFYTINRAKEKGIPVIELEPLRYLRGFPR